MGLLNINSGTQVPGYAGITHAHARAHVFSSNSDQYSPLYKDDDLTVMQANPMIADSEGSFPLCYLQSGDYRVEIEGPTGDRLLEQESISVGPTGPIGFVYGFPDSMTLQEDEALGYTSAASRRKVRAGELVHTAASDTSFRVCAETDNVPHITTAGGVKLRLLDTQTIDVRAFNPPTDGTSDASAALQAALNAFRDEIKGNTPNCKQCVLKITGNYTVNSQLLLEFNSVSVGRGVIDMSNGRITSGMNSGVMFRIACADGALVRNLRLQNMNLRSGGTNIDVLLELDGGTEQASSALYRWVIDAPQLSGGKVPLWIRNNCFEGAVSDLNIQPSAYTDGYYGILTDDYDNRVVPSDVNTVSGTSEGGNVSSIMITGGTIARGYHNIFERSPADLRVVGTTLLEAGAETHRNTAQQSGGLFHCHIENAWYNYVGATTERPVIRQDAYVMVEDCDYRQNTGVATVFIQSFLGANARSNIEKLSLPQSSIDYVRITNTSDNGGRLYVSPQTRGRLQYVNATVGPRLVSVPPSTFWNSLGSLSGAVDMDLRNGNSYFITATGNLTINAPASAHPGDTLTIIVTQDAAGGRTVTWNSAFKVGTAVGTAANTRTSWQFVCSGGVWTQIGVSGIV